MGLKNKLIIDLKKLTTNEAIALVDKYLSECGGMPLFSGLLLDVGITRDEYEKVTGEAKKVFEMFKFDLEVAMEKMLRYQENLKRDKYNKIIVDLKYIEWLLKKSNPSFWGDNSKKVEVKSNLVKNGNVFSIDNESGFTLTETQKESNN